MKFPGEDVRWGLIEVLAIMVLIFVVGVTYSFWGPPLLAYLVYKQVVSPSLTTEFVLSYLVQFIVTVGSVAFFALVVRRGSLRQLGFLGGGVRNWLKWGVGGGFLVFITILGIGILMDQLIPELPPQAFESVLRQVQSVEEFAVLLFIVSVVAPLAEELYFRSFVYPVFRKRTGVWAGAILAGLFFGLAHWDVWRLAPLALGGTVLCLIYEKSRSIYSCWLAHGLWNGAMGLVYYFAFFSHR